MPGLQVALRFGLGPLGPSAVRPAGVDAAVAVCDLGPMNLSIERGSWLLGALASLLLLLPFAAEADGATITLQGKVLGDPNSTVAMKVVTRRGVPVLVKRVIFRRVDHDCSDGFTRELTLRLPRSRVERVGITARFTFFELLSRPSGLPAPDNLNQLFVTGKMFRGVGRVRGTVDSTVRLLPVPPARANACIANKRDYVVHRVSRR